MSLNDPLANAMSHILNCEQKSLKTCTVKNASKFINSVFTLLKSKNYIKDFKSVKTQRGDFLEIELAGSINKCGVIKPRFSVKKNEYEKFEKRYLPAHGFGIIIVSTPKGLMMHDEAIEKGLGGKLIAYCY
jgi:small subunit ribosomal protein S8